MMGPFSPSLWGNLGPNYVVDVCGIYFTGGV